MHSNCVSGVGHCCILDRSTQHVGVAPLHACVHQKARSGMQVWELKVPAQSHIGQQ